MTTELDKNRIPQHIAIIMDGNGRWAMDRGLDRTFGNTLRYTLSRQRTGTAPTTR